MRCEQARELLPGYLDQTLHSVGVLEVHLATCAGCARLLAEYREMLDELGASKDRGEPPSIDLIERVLALIPSPTLATRVRGSLQAHPVIYAVASLGGAAVGATTVALMWRRRRALATVS